MANILDGYCTVGTQRETQLSGEQLLRLMDQAGIAQALIAPEDHELALDNQAGNQRIARVAEQSEGRFIPACAVNPWHGARGVEILRTALAEGARMLVFAPALQGFCPTDDLTDPLLHAAAQHHLPVYFHTGPHGFGGPTQVALLAQQFPQVNFIIGHCGSTDHAHDMPAILRTAPANLYFEISLVRPWVVPSYGQLIGESRLIFASSAPRNDPVFELHHFQQHWPTAEHPNTYGPNLAQLLAEVRP